MKTLVIGGTGPTGPHIVNGLIERGHETTILHTGRHESDLIPASVEHIHTDPFDQAAFTEALGDRTFDLVVSMYGRLRMIAETLVDRTDRLITIGGIAIYQGFMDPEELTPRGMPVPVPENAPLVTTTSGVRKTSKMRETEDLLFALHPAATHLRYPMLYGPDQIVPREWPIIQRIVDKRPFLILPDGGLTTKTVCYGINAAHTVLCAVDRPEVSAGKAYNVGDEQTLTLAQVAEVLADALGHTWEIVSMPTELAVPARPILTHWSSEHRVLDLTNTRTELGYRDVVPVVEALTRTAHWLVDNPPDERTRRLLQDPCDYAAEDALVAAWRAALPAVADAANAFATPPGFTATYAGTHPNPGDTRDTLRS